MVGQVMCAFAACDVQLTTFNKDHVAHVFQVAGVTMQQQLLFRPVSRTHYIIIFAHTFCICLVHLVVHG